VKIMHIHGSVLLRKGFKKPHDTEQEINCR